MKGKTFKILVLILALLISCSTLLGTTGCLFDNEEIEIVLEYDELPDNTNPNLKYFGYFHSDGLGTQGQFYAELDSMQNTNIHVVNSAWGNSERMLELEQARIRGKKVLLGFHSLHIWTGLWINGGTSGIYNDYKIWLNDAFGANGYLKKYVNDGTLLGLYFDEPMWNGVSHEDFITVTKYLRETYPYLRIVHCMTVYDLGFSTIKRASDGAVYQPITAEVNQYVTDVMYDYYGDWDVKQRQDLLSRLKAVATNNQWIWGCANTHVNTISNKNEKGELDSTEVKRALIGMYYEALEEPRYVGIIGYTLASSDGMDPTHNNAIGMAELIKPQSPYYDYELKKVNINVGRKIIGLGKIDIPR